MNYLPFNLSRSAHFKALSTPVALALSALITVFASPIALAQTAAPSGKVMRIIVPYAPGGPLDITARLMADGVKSSLGTVIIENRPGAGGNIGADAIAKAAPDGQTIGIAAVATHAINPWLYSKMPYNAATDFAPITQMVRVPNVLVMNADTARRLHINTLADLIRYAKANPAKLNYASGGNGSAGHLAGELFKAKSGIFALHIPYNGPEIETDWFNFTALNTPEAKPRFATLLAEPVGNTPEQFGALMKSELAKYEQVVKTSGAKVD